MGKEKRKWFQKGAFEDGYQIGDVYRALRATGKDVTTNFLAGATGLVEKAIDTGAYVVGGVGGLLGADKFKDKTANFIKKDIINEEKIGSILADVIGQNGVTALIDHVVIGDDYRKKYDDYSLLGEKSDSLVQSGGQLAAQIALQTFAGVPWWATTGVTSFGGSVEESLNDDASYGKAGISAAITTGADILTEKLFGGSGLGETGLIKLDKLTKGISNKAVKALVDWGLDVGSEGFEEVLAAFASRLGKALTYEREDTWKEILTNEKSMERYIKQVGNILFGKEARDEYKEAGIGGMILGGGTNTNNVAKSVKEGVDYRTGLTENEQKVFDNKYKKNIDEAKVKNGGKELDGKQKSQIYNNTVNEIKSGEIDAQTVEEALGGEEYSAYKNALGNYNTLQQKLNETQTADSNVKAQEQTTVEIQQRLEKVKQHADRLKDILENKITQKIDTDNIHLKDRESYLLDSYIKGIQKPINSIHNNNGSLKKIDEKAFVDGLWGREENHNNASAENVEKSQLESVENYDESGIIEETIEKDTGIPGEYTNEIEWSIHKHILVRKFGKGFFGKRVKQRNLRVDNYELKINPNNESYYLQHPDGRYVQFENMVDNVLQDGKCVLNKKRSFYHVYDRGYKAQNRVLEQANRQIETANAVGYRVEWLVSDEKAVEQISRLFKENNINISVKFYQE